MILDQNASISREDAKKLLKMPESNKIEVTSSQKTKMLMLNIKNHLMYFKEVEVIAKGRDVGKSLSAI